MNIVIFDLEWNQVLEGRTRIPGLPGEIIQIGAAKIDPDANVIDTFDVYIKPVKYVKLNKHVKDLTLISEKDLEGGISFEEAARSFRSFCGEECALLSWGPDDILMLENNLNFFGMDTSWLPTAYDAQLMFDDMEMQQDRQWPLNYALYHFEEKPYAAHNALADVMSTVAVLRHLDLEDGLSDDYFRCDI
jgi:inhibitor of KinA sporulation pathway (predicted exonuclease)